MKEVLLRFIGKFEQFILQKLEEIFVTNMLWNVEPCLKPKVEDGNEGKAVQHHKRTNYQKALHIFSPLYSYAVNSSSFSTVSLQNVYEKTMGPAYVHASGLQSQLSKWHPFTDSSEGVRRTARAKWVCALTRLKTTGGLVHKKLSVRFFLH